MGSVVVNIRPAMPVLSLLFLFPLCISAMSIGHENDISYFQVPELRSDYSFGDGGRPRMGKRESVEDAAELDDKEEMIPVIRYGRRRYNYIPSLEPLLRNFYAQNFRVQEPEEKKRGGLRTRLGRML